MTLVEHTLIPGEPTRTIYFYRADDPTYGFLSNLYPWKLYYEDRWFPDSETAYQFGKFKDRGVAEWAILAPKPRYLAILAHNLSVGDIYEPWYKDPDYKVNRMREVLWAKFSYFANAELGNKLLATGNAILVEASKTDKFWGIGPYKNGQNMLGKLLMETRKKLVDMRT